MAITHIHYIFVFYSEEFKIETNWIELVCQLPMVSHYCCKLSINFNQNQKNKYRHKDRNVDPHLCTHCYIFYSLYKESIFYVDKFPVKSFSIGVVFISVKSVPKLHVKGVLVIFHSFHSSSCLSGELGKHLHCLQRKHFHCHCLHKLHSLIPQLVWAYFLHFDRFRRLKMKD